MEEQTKRSVLARTTSTPRHASTESYLSELLSFSLDRLKKEPELLRQDAQRLERQADETSVTQYTAFLAANRCLASLHENCAQLKQFLESSSSVSHAVM